MVAAGCTNRMQSWSVDKLKGHLMLKPHTPPALHPPFAKYSHAMEVPPGARLVFASGQLGITKDKHVPEDAAGQADLCFKAVGEILASAGMSFADVVRINAYVTDRKYLKDYMAVRDRYVTDPPPASTLMIVSGFAAEIYKVEVEIVAAKA
jgi:enamine deaminase RidA (YjgF/YER057c/UK114 family)